MMMAIIGWLAIALIMSCVTIAVGLMFFNSIGEYNIGGKPNLWWEKVIAVVAVLAVIYFWRLLFRAAPFALTVTG